jgi:hypothetical protein
VSGSGTLSVSGTGTVQTLTSLRGLGFELVFFGAGSLKSYASVSGVGALGPHLTPTLPPPIMAGLRVAPYTRPNTVLEIRVTAWTRPTTQASLRFTRWTAPV